MNPARRRLSGGILLCLAVAATMLAPGMPSAQTGFRYVNATDPTCGGHSPCYATIQAAVNAALPGEHVIVQASTYHEQVNITGKNNTANATEADRIVIEADPAAAVGGVVLQGSVAQCTSGHAVRFQQSKFITLRGLTITGAGGQAVSLLGGNNQNTAIHLERLRIVGNGSSSCDGGITIARGNPNTLIVNSLIHANGRNGIATIDADGGPHYIIGNTIHGNQWSGVSITRTHTAYLVNNVVTGNGTASGSTGGRFGVSRESSTSPQPTGITLFNNLICGNRLGEINGPALDATDANNLTPTGAEGLGVVASAGCDATATVYDHLVGPNGVAGTSDDDFRLATGSPALDKGMDPRTLGLPASFNPLFETDFTGVASARPQNATAASSARFDIGAFEAKLPDTTAPSVTFQEPAVGGAYVRGTIPVTATATDTGSGVATFTLAADGQSLTATLTPTLPPPAASVVASASWNTMTVPDGTHTLTANATDAADNPGSATRVAIVDNTPPETTITDGPSGEISVASATFSFAGSDNLTPMTSLMFAWRLDGGSWTAFTAATTAPLTGLTEGSHTFEVKARDLALNEDLTPATRTFTVRFGPSIIDISPASGTIGTFVTITGTNFEPGATTVTFNGRAAVIRTVAPTVITTTVPVGAGTGPLVITTSRGVASRTFTVTLTGDFTITASPVTVRAIAGDQGSAHVVVTGNGTFTNLVAPTVTSTLNGITATFGSPYIAPGASAPLTFRVDSTVAAGTYAFTVTGSSSIDGRTITHTAPVALEILPQDTYAVTGRIMTAESIPQPIPGVSVALGSAFVLTDAGGNFILQAPPAGPNMLFVDGRTASVPDAQFPIIETQITVGASGPTRVPFTIYLPKLDTANAVNLPIDSNGFVTVETKVTTPAIPGLEVTVPQGTRITGPDGNPVAQLIITPVPIDRSPMPFPPGKSFPFLFAINPGGSVPSQPLPITFPNTTEDDPGTHSDLYYFDLSIGNWNVWGTGTTSVDGKRIVSDPGFGLPRLAWHSACGRRCILEPSAPPPWPKPGKKSGDPVDLFTGRLSIVKTDVTLPARVPIRIERTYWSGLTVPGYFGIGWNLEGYDVKLAARGTALALIQADQAQLLFVPDGINRWVNRSAPYMAGAVITPINSDFTFQLRLKDGTIQRFDRIVGFGDVAGLSSITDRNGSALTISRTGSSPTSFGQITRLTEPTGRHIDLEYDTGGRVETITDPTGRTVRYTYDSQGRLETVTDQAGGVTRYAYDASHRLVTITDPRNIIYLTNDYDSGDRVTRQTQGDGSVWQFAYQTEGPSVTQTTVTDPRGNTTVHRFNSQGFEVSMTDALGQSSTFDYAPTSNLLVATTDPIGRVTRFTYDEQGNVKTITDPAGKVRYITYELTFNQVTAITDPLGNLTQFAYDANGNLMTVTDPLLNSTTFTYNTFGQPLTATDPLNNIATFTYDSQGNLATIADPVGNVTTRAYDTASRLVGQTDARGKSMIFAYDLLNRLILIIDQLGGPTRYTYDGNNNLLSVTDPREGTITYTYDAADRLMTRADPLGRNESFDYDLAGNLTRHTDRKGQVATFTYDPVNRQTAATYIDATVTYTYDVVGRLTQAIDSAGGTITNAYDTMDRLISQATALGEITYTYDAFGRRRTMAAPGQATTTYGFDAASRLLSINRASAVVQIAYDAAGRRTKLTLPNGVATEYAYDGASRPTSLTYTLGPTVLGDLRYTYDAAGNRVAVGGSWARTGLPEPVGSASYDANNQQVSFGNRTLTYDLNGNLTDDGVNNYTWNARNQIAAISGPIPASFVYDAAGRRLQKIINGTVTDFIFDGLNPIQEVSGARAVSLLTGLDIDEYFVRTDETDVGAFLTDALGSTVALTNTSGEVATHYTYEPFGRTSMTGLASSNAFQYTGREDDGTGLHYYRARYYSSYFARFLSEDRLPITPGSGLYSYADSDPINRRDPLGLQAVPFPPIRVPVPVPGQPSSPSPEVREAARQLEDAVDSVIELVRRYVTPRTRGGWYCSARCNVVQIDPKTCCPPRVEGSAYGPDEETACREARRAATQSTPRGCYARHCQCACEKR